MKNILIALLSSIILTSCSTSYYYQICEVESNLTTDNNGAYLYTDSICDITYDFWSEGGEIKFFVYNTTDDILYIDLSKSFIIRNGLANDYFLGRTTSRTAGVYTMQGNKSVSVEEQNTTAIPPKSSKIISEYSILPSRYQDCDLYESPSKQANAIMTFTESSTPMIFTNYLTVKAAGGKEEVIKNTFYISQVSNQHRNATLKRKNAACETDLFRRQEMFFMQSSPRKFYFKYFPRAQKGMEFKR